MSKSKEAQKLEALLGALAAQDDKAAFKMIKKQPKLLTFSSLAFLIKVVNTPLLVKLKVRVTGEIARAFSYWHHCTALCA